MNKKKMLSLILCCFMVLSVGCSSANETVKTDEAPKVENQVEEVSKTEEPQKDMSEMTDEELSKFWIKSYLDFSKDAYTVYSETPSAEKARIDNKYADMDITKHQDDFDDIDNYNSTISDLADLISPTMQIQRYRTINNIKNGDLETNFYIYDLVKASYNLVEKYNLDYDLSYLDKAKEYIEANPIENRALIEFANVSMTQDTEGYYTFTGEIVNNNPKQTFSGFGDIILYKNGQIVGKEPIVINEIAPDSIGTFEMIPFNVDFDNYKMEITTPNWN